MKHCLTILVFSALVFRSSGQLTDVRKFQLDSIVSVMPVEVKKDLWKAHSIIDTFAVNDEEKVWAFYGYIGANFKYDMDRFRERKPPQYSPELTAQKGKAVCSDFARLFSAMCERSNIRCIDVIGRVKIGFFRKLASYAKLNFHPGLHEWNLVEFNSTWHLMDPTWNYVEKTERVKVYSEKTKSYSNLKIKRCSRVFYDPDPQFMAGTHAADHPAFYLLNNVPTYRSAFRKHPETCLSGYNFRSSLDSIFSVEFPDFSPVLVKGAKTYSGSSFLYYNYLYETSVPLLKPTRFQTFTTKTYNDAEARINRISQFMLDNHHFTYNELNEDFKKKIDKKRAALKRLEDQKKKYKK